MGDPVECETCDKGSGTVGLMIGADNADLRGNEFWCVTWQVEILPHLLLFLYNGFPKGLKKNNNTNKRTIPDPQIIAPMSSFSWVIRIPPAIKKTERIPILMNFL